MSFQQGEFLQAIRQMPEGGVRAAQDRGRARQMAGRQALTEEQKATSCRP